MADRLTTRTKPCDPGIVAGRFLKAEQFLGAAGTIREFADDETKIGDAYVTLCVHAGIAAADVICCLALGHHVQGDSHAEAVAELSRVRPDGRELGRALDALLQVKTRAGYGAQPVNAQQRRRAARNAERLVTAARARRSGV